MTKSPAPHVLRKRETGTKAAPGPSSLMRALRAVVRDTDQTEFREHIFLMGEEIDEAIEAGGNAGEASKKLDNAKARLRELTKARRICAAACGTVCKFSSK
jgi:hypothetical protein